MTFSTFTARGTTRPTGVVRSRWRALGATAGVLLAAVSLAAATPDGPAERSVVAATPDGPAERSVAAATPDGPAERSVVAATPDGPAERSVVADTPDGPAERSVADAIAVPKVVTTAGSARVGPAPTVRDRASRLVADPVRGTLAPDPPILARSQPTRVRIPAIGVDSELVGLGLQDDGRMEVPPGAFPAGWYTGAPTPGELGPAILAGHVDHGGTAGVFYRLRELEPGDTVEVARQDGSTAVFRVTRVEQHRKDAFPTAAVYGDIDHAGLRLITCGGPFDRRARSYTDNIVVFAELDPGDVGAGGRRS